MRKVFWDGLFDGFAGAGLLRPLHCPGIVGRYDNSLNKLDREYSRTARYWALGSLVVMIIGSAVLWPAHHYGAYALLGLGALRVIADIPVKNSYAQDGANDSRS